ncbi:MAG: hypothetical protein AABY07_05235, partial [Nanoarchaeota archaeon]
DKLKQYGLKLREEDEYLKRLVEDYKAKHPVIVFKSTPKPRPEIDELAKQGKTLKEIGKAVGLTHQRIIQILGRTGKNELRKEIRKKLKLEEKLSRLERKRSYQGIASLFTQRMLQLAEKEGWAYKKAAEYDISKRRINYRATPLEKLIKLFSLYEKALKEDKKLGLIELAKKSGFSYAAQVGKVLKRVGLEPLYGARDRHPTSKDKREAIKRAYSFMQNRDIAYFVGVNFPVVERAKYHYNLKRSPGIIDGKYRIVSQIYDAKDAGFKLDEIVELLSDYKEFDRPIVNKDLVRVILKDKTIKEDLVEKLRIMFDDNSINKPYLTNPRN